MIDNEIMKEFKQVWEALNKCMKSVLDLKTDLVKVLNQQLFFLLRVIHTDYKNKAFK